MWRKVQNVDLVDHYKKKSDNVRNTVKALCPLVFLDVDQINEAFEDLQEILDNMNLPKLTKYTIILKIRTLEDRDVGAREEHQISEKMWNVRTRTEEGIPRTNNKTEGRHRAIQGMVDYPHPSLWRFLSAVQKEESL